ncbi:DUF4097 domain-containing protein [Colwellia sp. D2M02]|uniref:DUF4097 family beta strand repeat-containing protein n=1 Tax=Colwellia asteriadis TaxID=517723 RepID=A0ABN1LAY8_9GAMM|nr:DUF4097 family beta strand repeat-containing protein [Colwellia sp. D2M02]MBU2894349.1 DUF4097 domain-containing protein [Colwellia sp. D2M02]
MLQHLSTLKLAPLALLVIASCAQAKTINKTFDVTAGGLLKLDTDIGAIKVNTHSQSTVLVQLNIEGEDQDKLHINFTTPANGINIEGDIKQGSSFFSGNKHIKATYTLTLPEQYNVDVETSGGSISIADLTGEVDVDTAGGSISLSKIHGDVEIETSGGSLKIDDVVGKIEAKTSGGSIKINLPTKPTKDSEFITSGGSITAYLAQDTAVSLTAKTSGGRVKSDFAVKGSVDKKSIVGTINGGGPKMLLKTSGGSIHIKEI